MSDAIERAAEKLNPPAFGYLTDSWYSSKEEQQEHANDAVHDARIIVKAALTNPDDPDWLARKLAELDGSEAVFGQSPPFLDIALERIRNQYRRRVQTIVEAVLGND